MEQEKNITLYSFDTNSQYLNLTLNSQPSVLIGSGTALYFDLSTSFKTQLSNFVSNNINNTLTGYNTFTALATFNSASSYGNINCVPLTDGAETGIGFFKHPNKNVSLAGDVWTMGRNFNNTNDHFVIACNNINNCLTIGTDGTVDIPYNLTVQGKALSTVVASQIHVAELNSANTFTETNTFNKSVIMNDTLTVKGVDILNKFQGYYDTFYIDTQIYTKAQIGLYLEDINALIYKSGTTNYITARDDNKNITKLAITSNQTDIVEISGLEAHFNIPLYATGISIDGLMSSYRSTSNWGNIRCLPSVSNNEASIGFFANSDSSINNIGDVWIIGRNLYNEKTNNFSIGNRDMPRCLEIDTTGSTTIKNNLTVSGNINSYQMTNINNSLSSLSASTTTISNQLATLSSTISKTQYFNYNLYSGSNQFYRLGTLTLPQNGHQAIISANLCFGYNIGNGAQSTQFRLQNYQLHINIYSSNGYTQGGGFLAGTSRAVDPGTYDGFNPASPKPYYGIFHNGFVNCFSPYVSPLGCYLGLTKDCLNKVDIWIDSYAYHGCPLVQVSQTAGSFDTSTQVQVSNLPTTGTIKLDMITYMPLFLYQNPNRIN